MKKFLFTLLGILSIVAAKAADEISFVNNWGNSVTITVNTSGGAQTGLNALSDADKQTLREALTITLKGSPDAADITALGTYATSVTVIDAEDLSVDVPTGATLPSTLVGLVVRKGQTLSTGLFSGAKWILSRSATDEGEISVLANAVGAYNDFFSKNPKGFMWATSTMHLMGTLGLSDVEAVKNTNCDAFDLSQTTGLSADQLLSKGTWNGHKLVLLPDGMAMPDAETAKQFSGNIAWQELRVVTKVGSQIVIASYNSPATLALSDAYLSGVATYADKTGNLSDADKAFLASKNITEGTEEVPFDGTTAEVDLTSQTLAQALSALYDGTGKTPEQSLKHLIIKAGSVSDLTAYTVLETLSLPTTSEAANRPTVPATMKYIYYKGVGDNHAGAAVQLFQAGQLGDAVNRYVDILNLTQLRLIGTAGAADLDFGSMHFDMTKVNLINLNEVSSAVVPADIKWNVVWDSDVPRVLIVAPQGADPTQYVSTDYGIRNMTGAVCAYSSDNTAFSVHVVNNYDVSLYDHPQLTMKITVADDNVSNVLNVFNALGNLNVPEIDLSGITFPNGTSLSVDNSRLARGIDLGTQTVYGNYTLTSTYTSFTSYTLGAHITGNLDLSGSIHLTQLNLSKAFVDGTITLPNASSITVTVSSQTMKEKVMAAGVPEEHITLDETVVGTVVERGNYVIINYSLTEQTKDEFANMLELAQSMAGTGKRIVIRATTGFQAENLALIKEKEADVYYDMYEIDGTNEYAQAGVKSLLKGIQDGTYRKPLGILLPQDLQYTAVDGEVACTVDEVAKLCIDFAARARTVSSEDKIVSLMFVNKGDSDDEAERNEQTKQHFNAGADIALMHDGLRTKSMMYLVGTDDNNFVNTNDRIPSSSLVTLLKVERDFQTGNANGEVTVERAGELGHIISFVSGMVEQENVNDLVVRTGNGAKLNADDMDAINTYGKLIGINLFSASVDDGLKLTNTHLERLGLRKGTVDYSAIASQLKTIVEYDPTEGREFVNVKVSEAGQCEKAFLLVEPSQRTYLKNVAILEGSEIGNDDLKFFGRLPNVCLIDLSDATLADGTELRNIITGDKQYNDRVAYILPTYMTTGANLSNAVLDFQYDGDWNRLLTMARYDDNTKKRLSIWTYPDKTAMANYAPVVTDETVITFMPKFAEVEVAPNVKITKPAGYMNFKQGEADLWDELVQLKCGAVDFTWVNISDLGYDFGTNHLASTVRHIIIPTNSTNKDGSETYQGFDDETAYTYGDILTVSTYKNPVAPFSDNCKYHGGVFTTDEPTLVTYVRTGGTGHFSEVYSLLNSGTQTVTRLNLIGTINCADIAAMKEYTAATKEDLHLATLAAEVDNPAACISGNDVVRYLALPDNISLTTEDADKCAYKDACTNLLAVGVYNTATNTYTTWSAKNIVDGKQQSSVAYLTKMIHPTTVDDRLAKNGQCATGLTNIVMSGYLNMADITVTTTAENCGLDEATIRTADLTNAIFPTQTDMVFTGATPEGTPAPACAGWGNALESVKLPVDASMDRLPDYMIGTSHNLTSICIPGNYKHIGRAAFYDNFQLTTIYTTEVDGNGDGRGAVLCYNAAGKNVDLNELKERGEAYPHTITLPEALESIQTEAFYLDEQYTDVYILSRGHVPTCEVNSFSKGTLVGWGGYNSTSPITRNSYQNGSERPFAILHWPATATQEEVKCYTDVTRRYSIYDELQTIDGNGNVYIWPNHIEFIHAYLTGTYGYLWDAYDPYTANNYDSTLGENDVRAKVTNASCTFDAEKYAGWHQFVLTGSTNYSPYVPEVAEEYVELDYYTICLPFDLTLNQLKTIFGVPEGKKLLRLKATDYETAPAGGFAPKVSTLYRVTRNYSTRNITLQFTGSLSDKAQKGEACSWNTTTEQYDAAANGTDGSPIVMKAGFPYLIVPIIPKTMKEEIQQVMAIEAWDMRAYLKLQYEALFGTIATGSDAKIPYQEWWVQAYKEDGEKDMNDSSPYRYLFIGTYDPMGRIPDWTYFMAYNSKQGYNTWYRNVWGERYQGTWNRNTAVIGANSDLTTNIADIPGMSSESSTTMNDKNRRSYSFSLTPQDDALIINGQKQNVTHTMTFGDDDGGITTAINQPNTTQRPTPNTQTGIYTMQGVLIRHDGNTKGLPQGMYIINGKKVIVK